MPVNRGRYFYWDSSVFTAYAKQEPGRVDIIETLWGEIAAHSEDRIVTSTLSIAEVVHGGALKLGHPLPPAMIARIDAIWTDPSVMVIEVPEVVMYHARDLMREGYTHSWSLQPYDAVHLATAWWLHQNVHPIHIIHGYDRGWPKFTPLVGGLVIAEPSVLVATQTRFAT